jgi:polyisoprenoid-binding protein YceI
MQFKVKHLMTTTVTGFLPEVETEGEDFTKASHILFTADVDSISINNEQRDTHLKLADFFDAENHGQLKFVGNRAPGFAKLHGDLTIRGTTRPVTVKVEYYGIVVDPYGQTKAGFTVNGNISLKEFGLTWDAVTEAGSVVVSDEIRLYAEIQLVNQG